jgi:hypothetical protein
MLLDYFGLWYRAFTAGSAGSGKGKARAPAVVVVSYAGKEYRVPVGELSVFLASLVEEPAVKKVQKKRVRKNKKSQHMPVIRLVEAPGEEIPHIQQTIDTFNDTLYRIWQRILLRKAQEQDDDEALILLMGAM